MLGQCGFASFAFIILSHDSGSCTAGSCLGHTPLCFQALIAWCRKEACVIITLPASCCVQKQFRGPFQLLPGTRKFPFGTFAVLSRNPLAKYFSREVIYFSLCVSDVQDTQSHPPFHRRTELKVKLLSYRPPVGWCALECLMITEAAYSVRPSSPQARPRCIATGNVAPKKRGQSCSIQMPCGILAIPICSGCVCFLLQHLNGMAFSLPAGQCWIAMLMGSLGAFLVRTGKRERRGGRNLGITRRRGGRMNRGVRQQLFPLLNGRVHPGLSPFFLPSFLRSSVGYSIPLSSFSPLNLLFLHATFSLPDPWSASR